jgi:hypothetical protein
VIRFPTVKESEAEVLRIVGNGNMSAGLREVIEIYRQLWEIGYRPTVPLKFFIRQWAKKKPPVKGAKRWSTVPPEYNPK